MQFFDLETWTADLPSGENHHKTQVSLSLGV